MKGMSVGIHSMICMRSSSGATWAGMKYSETCESSWGKTALQPPPKNTMNSHLRITNGRLIDPSQQLDQAGDLWNRDERILGIGAQPGLVADRTIDARGMIVCPGLIDMHV